MTATGFQRPQQLSLTSPEKSCAKCGIDVVGIKTPLPQFGSRSRGDFVEGQAVVVDAPRRFARGTLVGKDEIRALEASPVEAMLVHRFGHALFANECPEGH